MSRLYVLRVATALLALLCLASCVLPSQASRLQQKSVITDALSRLLADSQKQTLTGHRFKPLIKSPSFQIDIYVEEIQKDEPALGFVKEDMKTWVEAELARSAPKARIVSADEALKERTSKPNAGLLGQLSNWDVTARTLQVCFEFKYYKSVGLTAVTINLHFSRGMYSLSGFEVGRVYSRGLFGVIGTVDSAKAKIRDAVQGLVKDFADQWVIDNKE